MKQSLPGYNYPVLGEGLFLTLACISSASNSSGPIVSPNGEMSSASCLLYTDASASSAFFYRILLLGPNQLHFKYCNLTHIYILVSAGPLLLPSCTQLIFAEYGKSFLHKNH